MVVPLIAIAPAADGAWRAAILAGLPPVWLRHPLAHAHG
jgi:hypothetical protein